ncbi:MAG: hypothetical protein ACRERC_18385, partial [Candidatus Binatia bacterium]
LRLCLPPAAEDGRRLHRQTVYTGTWLPFWLRQHELCWRDERGEVRIGLFGNSAVYGFPLPAEQTVAEQVNRRFAESETPAHLFNLGYIFTYMLRDIVVIDAALPYDLDVIVYAFTLADMYHSAPAFYPPMLVRFFDTNLDTLAGLIANPPTGLEEPFGEMRPLLVKTPLLKRWSDRLDQIGIGVRLIATHHAEHIARRLAIMPPEQQPTTPQRNTTYDCAQTLADNERQLFDWHTWNVLESLNAIRARTGTAVLVVNWPVSHEPVGDCYNFRYSNPFANGFNAWMKSETDRLGLPYLDLHALLPPERFFDSLHLDADGQDQVAARVFDALRPLIDARRQAE